MLETIGRYLDPREARVPRARPEAEDIPAPVSGDRHIIADWPMAVATRLFAPAPFSTRACGHRWHHDD